MMTKKSKGDEVNNQQQEISEYSKYNELNITRDEISTRIDFKAMFLKNFLSLL